MHHEDAHSRIADHLAGTGWRRIPFSRTIRGIKPDIMVQKDGKIMAVAITGRRGDPENGVQRALRLKNAANYACLAIPDGAADDRIRAVCTGLGIGLVSVGRWQVTDVVRPVEKEAMESVKSSVFGAKKRRPAGGSDAAVGEGGRLLKTLFGPSFVRIMRVLLVDPGGEHYLTELARRTGLSASTVLRETGRLEPLNIITKARHGGVVFCSINRDCVIYDELRRMFLKLELADTVIADGMKKHDIRYALIFGSFAGGYETPESDIDILIVGDAPKDKVYESVMDLEKEVGREINSIHWSEAEFGKRRRSGLPLLGSIRENRVIMAVGNKDEFIRSIT